MANLSAAVAGKSAWRKADHPCYRIAVHLLALLPLSLMVWRASQDALGADPVRTLTHLTGWWALVFLLLSLAITPLRQLSGHAHFIKYRRMLGLWAFVLVSLHLSIYVALDLQFLWRELWNDIVKRPYITVGFTAWVLLVPLALTSTQGIMRKLGRRWGQLHKLVYLIAPLGVLHFLWLVKSDLREPLVFAAVLSALLGYRIFKHWQRKSAA